MKTHRNHHIVSALLRTLHTQTSPCTRSELAGLAELTIKQLSEELKYLVELGTVERTEDDLITRYQLKSIGIRPSGTHAWNLSIA